MLMMWYQDMHFVDVHDDFGSDNARVRKFAYCRDAGAVIFHLGSWYVKVNEVDEGEEC